MKCCAQNNKKKIAIIGPESTGKSTIATALARYFGSTFVPEFAREYIDQLKRPYAYEDLTAIAHGQLLLEEKAQKKAGNDYLFCDTDLYVLKVWSEHAYGRCEEWILRQIASRHYDYYFLTNIDLPWQPDPQREHPEPEMRAYFFHIYKDIVVQSGVPWTLLAGNENRRLTTAVEALKYHFGK